MNECQISKIVLFFIDLFFGHIMWHVGSSFLDQGSNVHLLQ